VGVFKMAAYHMSLVALLRELLGVVKSRIRGDISLLSGIVASVLS
jgi:hypothetical protein